MLQINQGLSGMLNSVFSDLKKKKGSFFPWSHFPFHNTIIYVTTDHFFSLSSKCEGRILPSGCYAVSLGSSSWLKPERVWVQTTVSHLAAGGSLSLQAYPLHKQGITGLSNERVSPEIYRKLQLPHPVYSKQWADCLSQCPQRRGNTESWGQSWKASSGVTCATTSRSDQTLAS